MDTEQAQSAPSPITRGLAESLSVLAASGATGNERTVLVWLLHGMDWKDGSGETWISTDTIADRGGIARSTACEALRRLTAAGVVVGRARFSGIARRIDWDALAGYRSQATKRGGDRPNIGQVSELRTVRTPDTSVRTSDTGSPVIGQGVSELRSRSSHYPPTDPPSDPHKKHAPAPAGADLFTPPSQPDAATGEATGDTTPPPSAAAPLPADDDAPVDPGKPREPITPAMAQAIDVLAKLNPKAAERMTEGKSETLVRATRKAIKALGLPALLARLEYAAVAQDDEPMKFWRTTLGGKLAPLLTVDGPWVRGLDEAAAEVAEQEAPEPVTTPSTPTAEISEAAAAWASMTFRHEWRLLDRGGVPKRPEDANRDDTPGVVFADDPTEHVRRWHAYRAAGGTRVWREVRGEADRLAFRDAFKAAYESGVISE